MLSTLQNWIGAGKELVNWCLEKLPVPPLDLLEGRFWFNTTTKRPQFYNGTEVKDFNSGVIKYAGIVDITGPLWTDNGGGSITMQSCKVAIYNNTSYSGDLTEYIIPAATFLLPDGGNNIVIVDYNAGDPEYRIATASATSYNHSNLIPIYRFWYAFGEVHSATLDSLGLGLAEKLAMRVGQVDYYHRVNNQGLTVSTNGANSLDVSSALVWAGPVLMDVLQYTSLTDACSYLYKDASNVWIKVPSTTIPNTYYNPVGSGLVSLTNGAKWSCVYFYRSIGNTNESFIVLDTKEYNSRDTALSESTPRSDLYEIVQSHCMLVGRAVFKYGVTIANTDIQSAFTVLFSAGSGTSDHEMLSNLYGGEASYHGHVTSAQNTQINNAGSANGFLILDSLGYVPMANIPIGLLGAMRYQATWDAATNTPTLPALPDASTKGYYWKVSVAGTYSGHTYSVGDFIISNGTSWDWCDNVDAVTSVFGRTGPVIAQSGDYNLDQVSDGLIYKRMMATEKTNAATAYTHSQSTENPHSTTKDQIGLGNVDNTSDADKPVSTATATAISDKVSKTDTVAQTVVSQLFVEAAGVPYTSTRRTAYTTGSYSGIHVTQETTATSIENFGVAYTAGIKDITASQAYDLGALKFYRATTGDLDTPTNRESRASLNISKDGNIVPKCVVGRQGVLIPLTDENYGGCIFFERVTGGYLSYLGKQPGNANANQTYLVESGGSPRIFIDAANNDGRVYLRTRDSSGNTVQVYLDSDGSLLANANPAVSDDSTKFTTTAWVKDVCPAISTGFSAGTKLYFQSVTTPRTDSNGLYFVY